MSNMTLEFGNIHELPKRMVDQMFQLRALVFDQQLGWVKSNGETEIDYYDALGPIYVICHAPADEVIAAVRLLPSTGPNMLRDVFPELLCGKDPPWADDVWESSRFFAVGRPPEISPVQTAFKLVEGMFTCALARGWRGIVSVSDVRMERLMRRTGVRIHRFGPPQRIGNMLAMAGWADVTRENLNLSANAAGSTGDLRLAS